MFLDCDANATYALDERGGELLVEAIQLLGNPSSLHRGGQRAKNAIDDARDAVSRLVGVSHATKGKYRVLFTSGATEANNLLIASHARPGARVVSSQVEHPCVLMPLERAAAHGCDVMLAPVAPQGAVTADTVISLVNEHTTLVSLMLANNETGVVNEVGAVSSALRAQGGHKATLHSDVAQVVGKMAFSMVDLGVDAVTISGHKFGSVSGVGALIVHESVSINPLILGGPQEEKLRGGTENVLGIVHMGLVAKEIVNKVAARAEAMQRVRDAFEKTVQAKLPGCVCNGAGLQRLPNTSSVFIPGARADDLVVALDLKGILVSAGAACSSGKPQPSHVLTAMGQDEERVRQTVRFSFRADQSEALGVQVAEVVSDVVARMRALRE